MASQSIDYYSILGVSTDSGAEEIRAAYKTKCFELHPDKNINDPSATAKFQDLLEAYTVLRDPEKRRMYDTGEDLDSCTCPECGRHHQGGFRSFFAQFFNSQFGGFNNFFDDDDDDRYERNFWKNFASRDRFAADWHSIPPTPSERELKLQAVPDKPSKPKAVLVNNSIKVEWAKRAPRKLVQEYVLEMKKGNGDFQGIYAGPEKEYDIDSVDTGLPYHFRVKAGNTSGFSDYSDLVSITPVIEEPQIEEEVQTIPGKKKKKKKATGAKSKIEKFVEELNEAIAVEDDVKMEKLLSQGRKLGPDLTSEVKRALERAETVLLSKQRTQEINSMRGSLAKVMKLQNFEELETAILSVSQFLKKASEWKEKEMGAICKDYAQALEQRTLFLQKKALKEQLVRDLDQAISARNLNWLSRLIQEAKEHGVPVKHAKKAERLLMAENQARKDLADAVESGNVQAIQAAINLIVNKPFQLRKELEYARSVLKLYEEKSLPTPASVANNQEKQQAKQLSDLDYIFLERFGMALS